MALTSTRWCRGVLTDEHPRRADSHAGTASARPRRSQAMSATTSPQSHRPIGSSSLHDIRLLSSPLETSLVSRRPPSFLFSLTTVHRLAPPPTGVRIGFGHPPIRFLQYATYSATSASSSVARSASVWSSYRPASGLRWTAPSLTPRLYVRRRNSDPFKAISPSVVHPPVSHHRIDEDRKCSTATSSTIPLDVIPVCHGCASSSGTTVGHRRLSAAAVGDP